MKVLFTKGIAAVAIACLLAVGAHAQTATWTGAGGLGWNDASWDNGGVVDTAENTFGDTRKLKLGDTANVTNGDTIEGNHQGDFRVEAGILNISGGSTINLHSGDGADPDGSWTVANFSELNLDNGTFSRTFDPDADSSNVEHPKVLSGGLFMLGAWGAGDLTDGMIRVNLDNGSTLSNDGIMTFGIDDDSPELDVKLSIAGGSTVDLTGGANIPGLGNNDLSTDTDLVLVHNIGHSNSYVIDFTGPGTLITDNGLAIATQDALGGWTHTLPSYEDLWNDGVLQYEGANSGAFADHFTVTGTKGAADYTLTVGSAGLDGDFDGDGDVDGSDFLTWQRDGGDLSLWTANYPPASTANFGSVPEPTSMLLVVLGGLAMLGARRS